MFPAANMSNSTNSLSEDASVSSGHARIQDFGSLNPLLQQEQQQQQKIKKKRSLPGNPDPDAEVIALSPKTLLATNRFVCEICNKGFQRDQNLQLHRRGHNLPWKLKQRNSKDIVKKRAYVCPEPTCVHHHPSRALGDLTGIKKHFCRKHGEKKWKCEKCSKIYAVQSDWKAHSKTCGTREYRCDCGTLFSRKDSFITHRAFCDALAEESARLSAHHHHHLQLISSSSTTSTTNTNIINLQNSQSLLHHPLNFPPPPPHQLISLSSTWDPPPQNPNTQNFMKPETTAGHHFHVPNIGPATSGFQTLTSAATSASPHLSATALLQKAASVGATQATSAAGQHQQQMSSHMMTPQLHDDVVGELESASRQRVVDSVVGLHQYHVPINPHPHHQQLGPTSDYQHDLGGTLAAWQKTDRLTRDFLGLTDDHHENNNRKSVVACANGNGVNVSVNMREMLAYTGGVVGFQQQYSERDHTLLKPHGFGFAQPSASGTWE